MTTTHPEWQQLKAHLREIELIDSIAGVLGWDEATYMPKKGATLRGEHMALLSRLAHSRTTDKRVGEWLERLDSSDPIQAACARNMGRTFRRELRVPSDLVDRSARARSEGFQRWLEAKEAKDFSIFEPILGTLVDLARERAAAIDSKRHPYEVLLEQYDPGTSVEGLRTLFARLREGLVPLLSAIAAQPKIPALEGPHPVEAQWTLSREIATALGYDFGAGRLDKSEHPFSTGQGDGDVRITTNLVASDLLTGIGSTIHETGHALYEQGLPRRFHGTTVCEAASYGLHESQSRFWENTIGRSREFCRWLAPRMEAAFPGKGMDAEALYRAQNRVEPGLIRVRADEVTYNLHVIVRFEIELALLDGSLAVADLPRVWNEKYEAYLGVTPPNDGVGVLQDVHWSGGSFGYFPSYTLGNLYAASLRCAIEAAIPNMWQLVEAGEFAPILAWLRTHVHDRGHVVEAPAIVRDAVGERDHVADLLDQFWARHGALYGLVRPT